MEDLELINNVVAFGCSDSFMEIVNRHSPLYTNICNKYKGPMAASGVPISDMEDDKFYFIYESIKTFNPDKNSKYSTWLANWTKYKCLSKITASNKEFTGGESFLDYCVNKDAEADTESEEAKLDIFEHVNEILESESEETQKIFKLRYFSNDKKNKKWSDIGDKLGISTQTAINKHNRAIEKIKMKVKKKNVDFSTK